MPSGIEIPLDKIRARAMANKMDVQANIVRNRLENGGPLSAQEIIGGVRLTHEDFLYIWEHARNSMYRASS